MSFLVNELTLCVCYFDKAGNARSIVIFDADNPVTLNTSKYDVGYAIFIEMCL